MTEPAQEASSPEADPGLDLRAAERRPAALLGLAFFALAFALLAARTARDALFLSTLPPSALPRAFAWSALAIAVGVLLASRLARRARPETLYSLAAATLCSLLFGARIALELQPRPDLAVPLYVVVEAGSAIALVLFWRLADAALAEARAANRVLELVEGATAALLLTASAWALLLLAAIEPEDLLLFAAAFLWLSVVPAVLLAARARRNATSSRGSAFSGLLAVVASADLRLAAGAAAVAALLTTLVDWQLKDLLAATYPGDPRAIARASVAVFAASALVALLTKTAAPLFRHRLGIVSGLVLGLLAAVAGQAFLLLAPVVWTAAVARAPLETLRPSPLDGTLSLVLRPVPRRLREHWAALVEEVLRPAALALGALALGALALAPREVAAAALCLILLLHLLLRSLNHEHARSIGLSRRRWAEPGEVLRRLVGGSAAAASVEVGLRRREPGAIAHALELAPVIAKDLSALVEPLLAHADANVRRLACDYYSVPGARRRGAPARVVVAARPGLATLLRRGLQDPDLAARASAVRAFCAVAGADALDEAAPFLEHPDPLLVAAAAVGLAHTPETSEVGRAAIARLARQGSPEGRRRAAEAIRDVGDPAHAKTVLRLLDDDEDPSVRRAALEAAGRLRDPQHLLPLLWALTSNETARGAEAALAGFDAGALEDALARHATDPRVGTGLLRALGRNGTEQAIQALTLALWSESGVLRTAAGQALARAVKLDPAVTLERARLVAACSLELAAAYRVLAAAEALALPDVPRSGASGCVTATSGAGARGVGTHQDAGERAALLMAWALDEEFERTAERLFLLLAALHPDALGATPEPARRALVLEALANQLAPGLARAMLRLFAAQPRGHKLRNATGVLTPPAVVPAAWLVTQLGSEDAWTVIAAASWVSAHELVTATPALLRLLERPHPLVRESALEALERLLPVEQLPGVVRPLLWDESAPIRERVDRLLSRIVDEAELRHASGSVERVYA